MKINLEDFVDKKVKVTLQDGREYEGIIKYFTNESNRKVFFIRSSNYDLINFDKEGINVYHPNSNIIHIEELPMNTNDILTEINKTKVQLHLLEAKLKQVEEQEKFNSEFFTPIAVHGEYVNCLTFLKTRQVKYINGCFNLHKTPQGRDYWKDIANEETFIADYDIQQIKDWVINYLIQKELLWKTPNLNSARTVSSLKKEQYLIGVKIQFFQNEQMS